MHINFLLLYFSAGLDEFLDLLKNLLLGDNVPIDLNKDCFYNRLIVAIFFNMLCIFLVQFPCFIQLHFKLFDPLLQLLHILLFHFAGLLSRQPILQKLVFFEVFRRPTFEVAMLPFFAAVPDGAGHWKIVQGFDLDIVLVDKFGNF